MTSSFIEDPPLLLDRANDPKVDLRHVLHAHPEMAFEERRTTGSSLIKDVSLLQSGPRDQLV